MIKASLPIPYLVAIVFAVLTIALLAYFLFVHFRSGENEMSYYECYAKFAQMCSSGVAKTRDDFLNKVPKCKTYRERLPTKCPFSGG